MTYTPGRLLEQNLINLRFLDRVTVCYNDGRVCLVVVFSTFTKGIVITWCQLVRISMTMWSIWPPHDPFICLDYRYSGSLIVPEVIYSGRIFAINSKLPFGAEQTVRKLIEVFERGPKDPNSDYICSVGELEFNALVVCRSFRRNLIKWCEVSCQLVFPSR